MQIIDMTRLLTDSSRKDVYKNDHDEYEYEYFRTIEDTYYDDIVWEDSIDDFNFELMHAGLWYFQKASLESRTRNKIKDSITR